LGDAKKTISLTASGLLFSAMADRKFRAYDAADGKVLMEKALDAPGSALPAIYEVDGKQYIILTLNAVGGPGGRGGRGRGAAPPPGAPPVQPVAASYRAYALPSR
jgi:quinoprotein glucose dehydrogenase